MMNWKAGCNWLLMRAASTLRRVSYRVERIAGSPKLAEERAWQPPAMPDWVREEMTGLAKLEPLLLPDENKFSFYAIPMRPEPGQAYAKINRLLKGKSFTHFVVVPWLKRGGADLGALHHANFLAGVSGASVLVVATEAADSPWRERLDTRVKFLDFGKTCAQLDIQEQVQVFARLVVQVAPEVVHVINSRVAWETIKRHGLALRQRSRLFASLYCDDFNESKVPVGYARNYLRDCIGDLHAVICDNAAYPLIWGGDLGVSLEKFKVIYFPTALNSNNPAGVQTGSKVLWAGRMDRQKRPELLIAVASRLPHITFDAYGSSLLDSSASGLVFPENVKIMGGYDGFSALPHEDYFCFLNTSEWDGLPNVLLEATAHGLPIVSPVVGGIGDFLNERTGYAVANEDAGLANKLAEKIEQARSDQKETNQRWRVAMSLVEQRHSATALRRSLNDLDGYISVI